MLNILLKSCSKDKVFLNKSGIRVLIYSNLSTYTVKKQFRNPSVSEADDGGAEPKVAEFGTFPPPFGSAPAFSTTEFDRLFCS